MDTLYAYLNMMPFMVPAFSALSCAFLILFSYSNNITGHERRVKRALLFYYMNSGFAWFCSFAFLYLPAEFFLIVNIPSLASALFAQIFLYKVFYIFTSPDGGRRSFARHYVIPGIICLVMLIWSFFIPYDVQLEIMRGKSSFVPAGYELYTRLFFSKVSLRALFSVIYIIFIIFRLVKYYHTVNVNTSLVRKPRKWVILILFLAFAAILSSGFGAFYPRTSPNITIWMLIPVIAIFCQHLILVYIVLRRQYVLYTTFGNVIATTDGKGEAPDLVKPRKYERLTVRRFEAYVSKQKPFLNKDLTVGDLAIELGTNRTYLSKMVNRSFGMNFTRYVNRWRLKELGRLSKLSSNKEKKIRDMVTEAGFTDYRHYLRAVQTEKEEETIHNTPEMEES